MQSFDDVKKWVSEHNEDGSGVDHLRKTVAVGIISGKSAGVARAWLEEQENGGQRRLEAEQLALSKRSTEAAESSAHAAAESAKHAAESAKWSKIAAVIAVFALLVSAWPYIKDFGRGAVADNSPGQH